MSPLERIGGLLETASAHTKCHPCGCYQDAVTALRDRELAAGLDCALVEAGSLFQERRYDCLGCETCWPADALNAAADLIDLPPGEGCAAAPAARRQGWPAYAGDYRVLRFSAPVAACTLHTRPLVERLAEAAPAGLSIVGSLQTENLGIERLVENVVSNPHIRHLLLCGEDTPGEVGHFPGQSLRALAGNGLDENGRIIGASGRGPVLKNIDRKLVDHFRRQVQVLDNRGTTDPEVLQAVIEEAAALDAAPLDCPAPGTARRVPVVPARRPGRLVLYPAGYIVVHIDRRRGLLLTKHYRNDGLLQTVCEGSDPMDLFAAMLEGGAVARTDHAACLGRQLTLAQAALEQGTDYIQDKAPCRQEGPGPDSGIRSGACGCGPSEREFQ